MEEGIHVLHQQVSSFMSDVVSVSITLFLKHQKVRQLEEEKGHSQQRADRAQQRTREMEEQNHGLQQQVSLHDHFMLIVIWILL